MAKKYSFEWDTCVALRKVHGIYCINPKGPNEEFVFTDMLEAAGVQYKVIDPEGPGGGWPVIEYTGTKEQLAPVMAMLNASGYDASEILEMLEDWDGDEDELVEILG